MSVRATARPVKRFTIILLQNSIGTVPVEAVLDLIRIKESVDNAQILGFPNGSMRQIKPSRL